MIETICASTCLTSMVCFTFEAKHRNVRALDTEVHMSRHRMGARGNVTSFPLPWEELLRQMQDDGEGGQDGEAPDLPHGGATLSDMVSVLLKTSEEDDPKSMASFIHQAHVRRDVVVELIAGARALGHRSYQKVNMDSVRKKAEGLPENGVPPEVVRLLPHDGSLDKIQIQKAAAPVDGRGSVEQVGKRLDESQPNAVMLEKSGMDEADINSQRIAALRSIVERLDDDVERPTVYFVHEKTTSSEIWDIHFIIFIFFCQYLRLD